MIKYIFLGLVQGLTEFLPVSSSGHLVILQRLLGVETDEIAVSVILHLGTLLAVIVFFRREIIGLFKDPRLLAMAAVVTVITGIIGVSAKDFFERLFNSPVAVGVAWLFTGAVLLSTRRLVMADNRRINLKDAVFLGLAQSLAIIPGVSRSGMTISALFYRKIERGLAFSFSFLVSIPVIMGAAALEFRKIEGIPRAESGNLLAGFIVSFLSGLAALLLLRLVINKMRFHYFSYYCLFMAAATLLFLR
jgi:undecaprenyl-diphosphatase